MHDTAAKRATIARLFNAIDSMDTKAFLANLSPHSKFRFGAAPAVQSKTPIGETVDAFFSTIAGLRHDLTHTIMEEHIVACEGNVTYTRHDGTTITLPFVNIFEFENDLISGYRIYIEIAPLYATSA